MSTRVSKRRSTFLHLLLFIGKPTFSHLIYYGSGALEMVTSLMGKLFSWQIFQRFFHDGGGLSFWIYSLAFDDLKVTNIIDFSSMGTSLREGRSY